MEGERSKVGLHTRKAYFLLSVQGTGTTHRAVRACQIAPRLRVPSRRTDALRCAPEQQASVVTQLDGGSGNGGSGNVNGTGGNGGSGGDDEEEYINVDQVRELLRDLSMHSRPCSHVVKYELVPRFQRTDWPSLWSMSVGLHVHAHNTGLSILKSYQDRSGAARKLR
jgi:hypothetical protein